MKVEIFQWFSNEFYKDEQKGAGICKELPSVVLTGAPKNNVSSNISILMR